ncbi:MAG: putative amidohydrolase YtcJ [Sphingobacteriales bacterium]|jgi:predicted amidohydrolase YtcJ
MKRFQSILLFVLLNLFLISCNQEKPSGTLYFNGVIYTVDGDFSKAEAMIVKNGTIVAIGKETPLRKNNSVEREIDLQGKPVYPGFNDAHSHFNGYAQQLSRVDLRGVNSMEEMVAKMEEHQKNNPGQWITGRGWDQSLWPGKEFPDNTLLNKSFPETPVLVRRVDGHAAYVNKKAFELAKISPDSKIEGGFLEVKNGKLTGLILDNAVDLIEIAIPKLTREEKSAALILAEKNLFEVGLTTVTDAGLDLEDIQILDSLQNKGVLKIKVYAMANPNQENFDFFEQEGSIKNERLTVNSFKLYGDGALGSRGACLLHPYSDKPQEIGFLLSSQDSLRKVAEKVFLLGFQLNTHCIGDSANRVMLNIYADFLNEGNDKRWRIEHCQVINPSDLNLMETFNIIPSVQPTHATSDMYWAKDRLGENRLAGAYAYNTLIKTTGLIAAGSDFPVEEINPLLGFASAVERKDAQGFPDDGFLPKEKITRIEALKAMTIWAAYAGFEDKNKGSLVEGKSADFVVLEKDIMTAPEGEIRNTKVIMTFVNGEKVYGN